MSRLTGAFGVSKIRPVKRTLPITLGLLMAVVGAVWTFQGLGYLEGSPMTGVAVWAIIGPLVAGFGVALLLVGVRRR
jgi:hypothetical protein